MTLTELETRKQEVQKDLDTLSMELLSTNQKGIALLTERGLLAKRIETGDYSQEQVEERIGVKTIDND